MIATCLAYLWLVWLGAKAQQNRLWMQEIHRTSRCDLSLFQLGMLWVLHCLNRGYNIPVGSTPYNGVKGWSPLKEEKPLSRSEVLSDETNIFGGENGSVSGYRRRSSGCKSL